MVANQTLSGTLSTLYRAANAVALAYQRLAPERFPPFSTSP